MSISWGTPVSFQGDLLVLALQDAVSPIIWQMERDRLRTAAFDVLERQSVFYVRFKPMDGDTSDIAVYHDRNAALAVLAQIHNVLGQDTSKKKGSGGGFVELAPSSPLVSGSFFGRFFDARAQGAALGVLAIALFITLSVLLFWLVPPPIQDPNVTMSFGENRTSGIPQSADDILQNRGPD
jgi:hypothetical protein